MATNDLTKQWLDYYLRESVSVFPLRSRSKYPLFSWQRFQSQHATPEEANDWMKDFPYINIAIVTGQISGLIVLDVDGPEGAAVIANLPEPLEQTVSVKTGNGIHYYFQAPDKPIANFARRRPGIDLRADGGYVVAPPSVHQTGKKYEFIITPNHDKPFRESLAPPPSWLIELAGSPERIFSHDQPEGSNYERKYTKTIIQYECNNVKKCAVGNRNFALYEAARNTMQLVTDQIGRTKLGIDLLAAAREAGLGDREALATIDSGKKFADAHPRNKRRSTNDDSFAR